MLPTLMWCASSSPAASRSSSRISSEAWRRSSSSSRNQSMRNSSSRWRSPLSSKTCFMLVQAPRLEHVLEVGVPDPEPAEADLARFGAAVGPVEEAPLPPDVHLDRPGDRPVQAEQLDVRRPCSVRPIRGADDLGVRGGRDDRADLGLHVALDHRLRRSAAFLAPDERDLGARLALRRRRPSRARASSSRWSCSRRTSTRRPSCRPSAPCRSATSSSWTAAGRCTSPCRPSGTSSPSRGRRRRRSRRA